MRVLIVGTVPPPGGERARALARIATARLAAGDTVEICSPDPRSAAHGSGPLQGLRLVARLAAASRRFDAVVLRLEPGLPFRNNEGRLARAGLLALLGLVLRRFGEVRLHLDSPIPIPWGVGGRPSRDLWSRAHVVVENEDDRDLVLAVPWIDEGRVEVAPVGPPPEREKVAPWPAPDTEDLRAAVVSAVRSRAVAAQRLERAGADLAAAVGPGRPALEDVFEASPETVSVTLGAFARAACRKVVARLRRAAGR